MLKKIFLFVLIILFAQHTQAAPKYDWSPELRIGLLSGVNKISLKVSARCFLLDSKGKKLGIIPANEEFFVAFAKLKEDAIEIRPEKTLLKDLRTTINGKKYFGGVRVNKSKTSLAVINIVPIEEYLRGVVSKEMSPSFPQEALKAQTVAARSFAMKNRKRHDKEGFDLCDGTHCQVYIGFADYESTDSAVSGTRGEILMFKNKIADTNFHTDSGGMTESVGEVWGTHTPYLIAVKEILELGEPWIVKVDMKNFTSRLGENFGDVKSIKLSKMSIGKGSGDRSLSGRVKFVLINDKKFTGADMRRKYSLPSTLFDMKLEGNTIIFTGYGRGHGVGMSQIGAKSYAQNGWSYKKILEHYYRGAELKKVY